MHVFIVNPAAGNGRGTTIIKEYINNHSNRNDRTYYTEYPGHAEEITEQVVSLYHHSIELLIVVGGDGTMYEVLNGLKKFPSIPIAFVPVGSGNDFARGCQMPLNPEANLKETVSTNLKPYWAGKYITDFKNSNHYQLFASSLGFGFDAEVAERANQSKLKKWFNRMHLKSLIYVFGLFLSIIQFKPKNIRLTIDGEERHLTNIWMLTITNHPYFGGGMKIAPNATINKNTFYVTIVHQISKWKLLFLFLTVFLGKHTLLKEVESLEASNIELNSQQKLTFHADGYTAQCYRCHIEKEGMTRLVKRK